jgi:uncharacterized CHY-type Zn-finger protein
MGNFKDTEHLLRLAAVFIIGIVLFMIVRAWLVPHSFGRYGHFRGDAIQDVAARPVAFAGRAACETCHSDIVDLKTKGKHAGVGCESCHGPLAKHADDPSIHPQKLDVANLCVRCHEASSARPKWFPQVASEEHSSGVPCDTCHQPHSPAIEGKKTVEAQLK